MSKAITEKSFKEGSVVKNRLGQFTKIIRVASGMVHFSGWAASKEAAEKAEKDTQFLNIRGMARALGDMESITNPGESDGVATDETEGEDDTTTEDGGDDDDGADDESVDLESLTVPELKAICTEAELPVGGTKAELIDRIQAAGIELE